MTISDKKNNVTARLIGNYHSSLRRTSHNVNLRTPTGMFKSSVLTANKTQTSCVTGPLMLLREVITLYSENYQKALNTFCAQNARPFIVKTNSRARDAQLFLKSRSHLKILCIRKMVQNKFHSGDPRILGTTVQNLCNPVLDNRPVRSQLALCSKR